MLWLLVVAVGVLAMMGVWSALLAHPRSQTFAAMAVILFVVSFAFPSVMVVAGVCLIVAVLRRLS